MAEPKAPPPGVIAIPTQEHWRYTRSMLDAYGCKRPTGSKLSTVMGMDVTLSLNEIVKDALADENDYQWAWFQSDDHLYDDESLLTLLAHDVDVVVPLVAKKAPPYGFVIYKSEYVGMTDEGIPIPEYDHVQLDEIPAEGLFKVYAAGSGGMLVKRRVLEAIAPPWFESSSGAYINDDLEFCRKIRNAGFEIHCDPSVCMGHLSTYVVSPARKNGRWGIQLDFGTGKGDNRIWFGDDPRKIAAEQERLEREEAEALA